MTKSELIAHCLVEAKIAATLDAGTAIFNKVWQERFSAWALAPWDQDVPEAVEKEFRERAKGKTSVNVARLIQELTPQTPTPQKKHV